MRRRTALQAGLGLTLATRAVAHAPERERFAAAWRRAGRDHAALLEIDWASGHLAIRAEVPLPGRAHGLEPLPDGGVVVVGTRPGRWIWRLDALGTVVAARNWTDAPDSRTLNGHALLGLDGTSLLSTETDPRTGRGWVGVRDLGTLSLTDAFETHGIDPHHLLHTGDGHVVVANGGIPRDTQGRRRHDEAVNSSLVLLERATGRLRGRWTLSDRELSMRHLAWSQDGQRLGIALQGEHPDAALREAAPLLAVLDGHRLSVPSQGPKPGGYAGDIVAAPGGGFVLSAQMAGRCLWWHPAADSLIRVAELTEPCALAPSADGAGVAIGAALGPARWHVRGAARMLAWPAPLAHDNHWVRLQVP